ncbi:MAG: hypothetical protein JWM68_3454 [Verrucomicrobiales bacterium]|nr:hypothetical protein [Verrucomicrobiales bacterium]
MEPVLRLPELRLLLYMRYLGFFLLFAFSAFADKPNLFLPTAPPDWKLETVAIAPKVQTPTVLCCAPDGRLFVGQDPMDMLRPSDQPSDSIICIYPNGKITVFATNLYAVFGMQYLDGKLYVHHTPKFSVFDDSNGVGTNRVDLIESDNPHPWAPTFNDHIPSNFRLGMDGFFYISTGDKGIFGAKGKDGKQIELHGGGVFRMRPDGTDLEVYSTGTRNHLDVAINSEDEIFTYDNTDDGQGWWSRVTHMVDGGVYGYPYDYKPQRPYTLWMMADYAGGSATGTIAYNEDGLPDEYKGNVFLCDWGRQEVLRLKTGRIGGTYTIVSREKYPQGDFLSQTNKNAGSMDFRPVGIAVSPDGKSFYIADWYCAGWKARGGNDTLTEPSGRVLKLTYTGKIKQTSKPDWYVPAGTGKKFKAKTKELIKGLSHPSQGVRLVAQRRLAERKFDGYSRIVSLLKDTKAPAYARWSAIWTLDAIDQGVKSRSDIIRALKDKDASVVMQAARQLGTRHAKEATVALIPLLKDSNPAVVFRAATALGRIGPVSAVSPLIATLQQKDLFARFAAFTALKRIGQVDPKAWSEITRGLLSDIPAVSEGTGFALRDTFDVEMVNQLVDLASSSSTAISVRTNIFGILQRVYRKEPNWLGDWWNTQPSTGSAPNRTVDWSGTVAIASTMRKATKDSDAAIRRLGFQWVETSHDSASAPSLREMFSTESDAALKIDILKALGELKDAGSSNLISQVLENKNTPNELLNAAIEAAGKIHTPETDKALIKVADRNLPSDTLSRLVQSFGTSRLAIATPVLGKHLMHTNSAVRQNAETALIQIGGEPATKEFLTVLNNNSEIERRRSAARSLGTLKAKSAIPALLDASTNPSTREEATTALAQMPEPSALEAFLVSLDSKNATLRLQCQQAIESMRDAALPLLEKKMATNGISTDLAGPLQKIYATHTNALTGPLFKIRATQLLAKDYESFAVKHEGDAERGKIIFNNLNGVACAKCHRINKEGGEVGPDLTDIIKKYGRPNIIDSVLHPSKQILDGYQVTNFELKNAEAISGAVRAENTDEVTVIDSAGEKHHIRKSDISKRKISQVSLMPEELHTGLSLLEFSDLISYVVATQPTNGVVIHSNLGNTLHKQGKLQEAKEEYLACLKIDPKSADAHYNLGNIWAEIGNPTEAIVQFKEALRLNATLAEAHNNIGALLNKSGDNAQAETHFVQAIKLSPTSAEAHRNFASLLLAQGRIKEAITQYEEVIKIKPEEPEGHSILGRLLAAEKPEAAITQFREVIRLRTNGVTGLNDLAWLLATHPKQTVRNGNEAIKLAERACELTAPPEAKSLDILGAAYAEAGRFDDAVLKAQAAQTLAISSGKKDFAETIGNRIELYKNRQPFRLGSAESVASVTDTQTNRQVEMISSTNTVTNTVVKLTPVKITSLPATITSGEVPKPHLHSPLSPPPPPPPPPFQRTTVKPGKTNSLLKAPPQGPDAVIAPQQK